MPRRFYDLPERDDPAYDKAAARALLEAARETRRNSPSAPRDRRHPGEPKPRRYVEEFLAAAERDKDDRLEQVAGDF